ncbi:hypothetical protein AK812_SmicGene18964 [Symbiodinium microadriaticum]|uniref:Uncharacterized protein n=1 Tax=Symbiodinium microadriaticum TaxID=2951 RepID=A0A1Q9DTY5_SYMMI|nr:hypothetical protein AK812_SmicGene18964 [Symbiodinium microadriaticum]
MRVDGFQLPCTATAVFVLHNVFVDTFVVGAGTPYQLKCPFMGGKAGVARFHVTCASWMRALTLCSFRWNPYIR